MVLEASQKWQSSSLRATALRYLGKFKLGLSERLALASRYSIDDWMLGVLRNLCTRAAPPTAEEQELLDAHQLQALYRARESFRNYFMSKRQHGRFCPTECCWSDTMNHCILRMMEHDLLISGSQDDVVDGYMTLLSSGAYKECRDCARERASKRNSFRSVAADSVQKSLSSRHPPEPPKDTALSSIAQLQLRILSSRQAA